ncbi:hypothetical protein KUL42_21050 [Alteromonas sp. KUL42]|uniref:hypothetical protein n=1 Tax=Alteromonas sp. KUL42 TaxID=2480797 RepID=UPI001035B04F|nr:hypothetical protein [Alteromonas sp. KUL42]TAP35069.1 hypothetical protein EYR97_10375 [Alteromonas sp. KUL42]GEA07344.1 hypothetical protein KUL42_21050 [Alteromonas sp. KUL42]
MIAFSVSLVSVCVFVWLIHIFNIVGLLLSATRLIYQTSQKVVTSNISDAEKQAIAQSVAVDLFANMVKVILRCSMALLVSLLPVLIAVILGVTSKDAMLDVLGSPILLILSAVAFGISFMAIRRV